ncbi:ATP-dependent DNA helicase RecG [Zooshikella ganghwensis]|uniref:ATP-dependent DNA helicase RecG n=1 Tax=Zooshikella ganghwensis TaxID=202772 RepID=A0A4P9VI36_9GAMM|nr:ATP-dependent DNA helicase RecG [Zooshikella ganghwensis]RDH42109.1 ATP-dependent DNA helicase RecG [Zooshikella ganghwensis]
MESTSSQPPLHQVPISALSGIGSSTAAKLQRLGISTIQDLLLHLPLRYQDRTQITPINQLQHSAEVVIQGTIQSAHLTPGKRRSLIVKIKDDSGCSLQLRFFHFAAAQKQQFQSGRLMQCFGEVRRGQHGLELIHPEYEFINTSTASLSPSADMAALTPVYPATEGLTQKKIRQYCQQALKYLAQLKELLPDEAVLPPQLMPLSQAITVLHNPPPSTNISQLEQGSHPAQQRLCLEELLAHHLNLLKLRFTKRQFKSSPLPADTQYIPGFLSCLPFALTQAQQKVYDEIATDLAHHHPMLRLVQGDVGSGKTVVAALAALHAIANGQQAAIMAPTEILAEQHLENFSNWFTPLGISVCWLTGKMSTKERNTALEAIQSGQAQLVVGTHALFQEQVLFHQLALVIIDEQHRFGVHQRLALTQKGESNQYTPHQLIMTATPIPRTLAMSAYADLNCSVIDELPPGRTPVNTVAIPDTRRPMVIQRVQHAIQEGRQVYWVCTLIETSEAIESQAAEETAELLKEQLPGIRVGLIHGRMKANEKAAVMAAFKEGNLDLLAATTVIEVGVNVPNASLMIIENSERLGLAQLHQLRGRVGRGSVASHCVLLYHHPLSHQSRERLSIMRETNDGFLIAEKDLQLRGPGEVLGTRQTGVANLKIADILRDQALLPTVQHIAQLLLTHYPERVDTIIERWLDQEVINYARV